jgi:hypothetical protein
MNSSTSIDWLLHCIVSTITGIIIWTFKSFYPWANTFAYKIKMFGFPWITQPIAITASTFWVWSIFLHHKSVQTSRNIMNNMFSGGNFPKKALFCSIIQTFCYSFIPFCNTPKTKIFRLWNTVLS